MTQDTIYNKEEPEKVLGLDILDLEWLLILGASPESSLEELINGSTSQTTLDNIDNLFKGEFEKVITSEGSRSLLSAIKNSNSIREALSSNDIDAALTAYQLELHTNIQNSNLSLEQTFLHLCLGISILKLFVQVAWTGPKSSLKGIDLLPKEFASIDETKLNQAILDRLSIDGEEAYHLMTQPLLLWLAESILKPLEKLLVSAPWWLARSYFLRQRVLDNPTSTLQDSIEALMGGVFQNLPQVKESSVLSAEKIKELNGRFFIEFGLHNQYFYNDRDAVKRFSQAQSCTGLSWKLTGALGKRTKFQQNEITQLVLWAKSQLEDSTETQTSIPKDLALNDDILLEKIHFSKSQGAEESGQEDVTNQGVLKAVDQCILLAFCLNVKNTNPSHGLTTEEMMPYVARVLENPVNWTVYTVALLLRSRLEAHKSRTVERSVLQLQALVDQFDLTESPVTERLEHFFSLQMPSKWEMEKELASRFMSLGCVRSALEIFLRLEMWEQAVECHRLLEEKDKAYSLVDTQLKIYPNSPKLLCLKGDVLSQPEWWYKAWEVSGNRFGRAMRSLGSHYFTNEDYSKSVECYLNALKINPLFENSWFVCGCAAMRIENWEVAQKAFHKVAMLDPDNGEAWNNLASAHIRQGRKPEAFLALQQALRQNRENWKIWLNYLYIAIDLGHFSDSIRAMEKIVDLCWESQKERCVDKEILGILINAIGTNMDDSNGVGAARLRPRLQELIDVSISGRIAGDPGIWQLAAKFHASGDGCDLSRALDCHLKAFRCSLNNPNLLTDHEAFSSCAVAALDLVDAYANYGPKSSPSGALICEDWKYQSRLLLRNLISRTRDSFEFDPEHDLLVNALADLKQ